MYQTAKAAAYKMTARGGVIVNKHTRAEEVIFVHKGTLTIKVENELILLGEGDNFTTPIGSVRTFENNGEQDCIVYVTRRGDVPDAPVYI